MHHFAVLLSFATFILILAGGLVTSTGSGLSVPDWPLSYGQLFPPMIGGIRFEHSHRVIAGFVGILTLAFFLALLKYEQRRWVRGLGLTALLAVLLQAVLGGLTVIYLLPKAVSISHASLAQSFFALTCILASVTSKDWLNAKALASKEGVHVQRLSGAITFFCFCQLIAGAVVRHNGGYGISVHIGLALLILMHVLFVNLKIGLEENLRLKLSQDAIVLAVLVSVQIGLGLTAFLFKYSKPLPEIPGLDIVLSATAHQSLGALILAASALLTLHSLRHFKKC